MPKQSTQEEKNRKGKGWFDKNRSATETWSPGSPSSCTSCLIPSRSHLAPHPIGNPRHWHPSAVSKAVSASSACSLIGAVSRVGFEFAPAVSAPSRIINQRALGKSSLGLAFRRVPASCPGVQLLRACRDRAISVPVACCSIPRYTRNRGEVAVALRPRVSRSTMQSLLNTDCSTKARKHESGVTSGLGYDGCPSLTRLSACVAEQKRFEVLRRLKACLDSQAGS